jgi:hypothetical protein
VSASIETITSAGPKYAAHGIKVSNEKRKCHHPTRPPIGASASGTTAAAANVSFPCATPVALLAPAKGLIGWSRIHQREPLKGSPAAEAEFTGFAGGANRI